MLTKKMKRVFGIILTLAMCIALLPSAVFAVEHGESTFYAVGTMTNWRAESEYIMTKSSETPGMYLLAGVELSRGDEFQIVETNNNIQGFEPKWYPDGLGTEYIVSADGIYDIYFRPNYDGGDDWYYNCIYVTPHIAVIGVTGVTLDISEMTLEEDETGTLTATVLPADAANKAVTWTSSDTSVATVSNGVVTANGSGTAVITVTTDDGGYAASCTVTVPEDIALPESTFYVVGTMTDWRAESEYIMTKSSEDQGMYLLAGVELSNYDEFKIVETNNSIQGFEPQWYPSGYDNYVVDADGIYDIYFRPNYDGGDDWFYNCIYVTPHEESSPSIPELVCASSVLNGNIVIQVASDEIISTKDLHIAIYSDENVLLNYIIVPHFGEYNTINTVFQDVPEADYAKVFLWEGVSTMEPITAAQTVNIVR